MSGDLYRVVVTRVSSGQWRIDVVGPVGRVARRWFGRFQERKARQWGEIQAAQAQEQHELLRQELVRARAG